MFLYLIRHGNPDYTTDTLKPEGVEEAKLVARRMQMSGVDKIYASPMGRAQQTASYTAELLNLPITTCEWAHELGEESASDFPDGQRRIMMRSPRSDFVAEEFRTLSNEEALERIPRFRNNGFAAKYKEISDGLDAMLAENGFVRNERGFYDVAEYNEKHIALFAHNGMGRVVVSHLLNIPHQFVANGINNQYTGVTVFYFGDGHFVSENSDEYRQAHPEFEPDYEIVSRTNEHIANTGLPETLPYLVSYGDIGHLYFDGNAPTYFFSKTKV